MNVINVHGDINMSGNRTMGSSKSRNETYYSHPAGYASEGPRQNLKHGKAS